jgi:glycosyltransferase involved in cell wall biosynthesis
LRILTFLHSFEPGGVERVALRLVRRWREEGVDAPLFMGRTAGAMCDEMGADLSYLTPWTPFKVDWFETLWMIATLPRAIRQLQPDALFCAGNSYAVVAVAMKIILGRACPPILAKISNDLERRDMRWAIRQLYRGWLQIQGRFIDHFVGMEGPMEDEIQDAIRPGKHRISIIPDPALSISQIKGLREESLKRGDALGTARRFVAVGRLAPQKNFALMLRAFAQGAGAGDTLTILGEGPERPALMALARKLAIDRRVILTGHVPNPAGLLFCFDLFLLSSDYEGVPAVLLEALAARLPIISTNCSRSMRTLLRDGMLGQLLPTGDVDAFALAIRNARSLHQDPVASLEQARRFTLERASQDYLTALASVIATNRQENSRTGLRRIGEGVVTAPKQ